MTFFDEKFLLEDEANAIVRVDFSVHKMRVNSHKIKFIMHYVGISYDISFPSTMSSVWLTIHPPGLGQNETVLYIDFYLLS